MSLPVQMSELNKPLLSAAAGSTVVVINQSTTAQVANCVFCNLPCTTEAEKSMKQHEICARRDDEAFVLRELKAGLFCITALVAGFGAYLLLLK